MIALNCEGVAKSYGSVVALRSANLSLNKGEVRGILGGNGSGKSTLAKILGGSVKQNEGNIKLYGKQFRVHSPAESKERGVIITSQELSLFGNLSVENNLLMCKIPTKAKLFIHKKELRQKALHILEKIKLSHLLHKRVEELAANEQYMIEFAKALIQEPQILIIDEITSALYREEVEIVKNEVSMLKNNGCSVLFISHRMSEIYSICDTVTVMKNGETLGTFPIGEKNESELLSLMTGKETVSNETGFYSEPSDYSEVPPLLKIGELPIHSYNKKVQLEVRPGEILGIAGLQGHGQSDLVRALFGLMGHIDVQFEDKNVQISTARDAATAGIAFVSGDRQKEGAFAGRSISENLCLVNDLILKKEKITEDRLLERYGVKFHTTNQAISTLSGGNQQKVIIGRWTASQPKILLADDPTKGIDVSARRDVHRIFQDLAASGSAIIMVSSDDEELVQFTREAPFSRVLVMYEGEIVKTLTGADITTKNIIVASIPEGA